MEERESRAEEERVKAEAEKKAEEEKEKEEKEEVGDEEVKSSKPSEKGGPTLENIDADEDLPEAMKTISSSKKLLSEHLHSVGGTSRSIGRSTKFFQRVQEISDKQKIAKWEDMQAEYYAEGMTEFNAMRNLRQRVCRSLNDTQRKFIDYLGRMRKMQQTKINDYCDNYNRFSREFPDLISNKETQKELLNRVDILSKNLWENIKERKDQNM